MNAIARIRQRLEWCEAEGVEILCCPEAVLGGLADDAPQPAALAIEVDSGQLAATLRPLASDLVTTIIGFTERSPSGHLHNSAAVFHQGAVLGVYRKRHPAIRKSIYTAGLEMPVFMIGDLRFGILICNDSNYAEPARIMAAQGATALFVPTNNGLPPDRADVVAEARSVDIARATDNGVWVIRADVAGRTARLMSYGSSGIVDPHGTVVAAAQPLCEDLLVADLDCSQRSGKPNA